MFIVEEAVDGGFVAKALEASIVTEADTMDELRTMIKDAVLCHFEEGKAPKIIRLHYVKDEMIVV